MKFKKSEAKTKEGLSLANYSDGWSMEYGEGGSYTVDLLYRGKKVATIIEEGNGGPALIEEESDMPVEEVKNAILAALLRVAPELYGPGKFRDITKIKRLTESEYGILVEELINAHNMAKDAKKAFKNGSQGVLLIVNKYDYRTVKAIRDNEEACKLYAQNAGLIKEDSRLIYLRSGDSLSI